MNSNQWLDQLKKKRKVRMVFSILMIIASSLLQTYVIQAFINPANLLSAGFTGVESWTVLYERLLQRNYPEALIQDLFFNNLMRVVSEVCIM